MSLSLCVWMWLVGWWQEPERHPADAGCQVSERLRRTERDGHARDGVVGAASDVSRGSSSRAAGRAGDSDARTVDARQRRTGIGERDLHGGHLLASRRVRDTAMVTDRQGLNQKSFFPAR